MHTTRRAVSPPEVRVRRIIDDHTTDAYGFDRRDVRNFDQLAAIGAEGQRKHRDSTKNVACILADPVALTEAADVDRRQQLTGLQQDRD